MKIIKTSEALPKSGRYVLAWMEGAKIPMRAMWAAQHTLPLGDDADPEWGEYSEEKDEYFCPAGWYEMNQHEEQHWGVDGNVVAWCELPRLDHQCLAQIEEPAQPVAPKGDYPQLPDPDSYLFQHEETGLTQYVEAQQVEWGFEKNNPRWKKCEGVFSESQMHAYFDLGRQPATAAPAPAAPAREAPAAPLLQALQVSRQPDCPEGHVLREWTQGWNECAAYVERSALAAAPQAPAAPTWDQLRAMAVKHGAWISGYGPFATELLATYGRAPEDQPHWAVEWMNAMRAMAAPAAHAVDASSTDDEIEAEFIQAGGKWTGDYWKIEDADLHPYARRVEHRAAIAAQAKEGGDQ